MGAQPLPPWKEQNKAPPWVKFLCTPLPKNYIYEVSVEWKMIAWYEILPVYGNRKNKVYSFHQIYFYPTFIRIKGSVREKWKGV